MWQYQHGLRLKTSWLCFLVFLGLLITVTGCSAEKRDSRPVFEAEVDRVSAIAFSPDSKYFTWANYLTTEIRIVGTKDFRTIATIPCDHNIRSVAFSSDNKYLALGGDASPITIVDATTWIPLWSLPDSKEQISYLHFSPTGNLLASVSGRGDIVLWDYHDNKQICILDTSRSAAEQVDFSQNGEYLVTNCLTDGICVYDVKQRKKQWSFSQPKHPVTHVASVHGLGFLPNNQDLVTGGSDGLIRFWNVLDKKELQPSIITGFDTVRSMAISSDGKRIAAANLLPPGIVRIWDRETQKELGGLSHQAEGAYHLCFSPAGDLLAAAVAGGKNKWTLRVWRTKDLYSK